MTAEENTDLQSARRTLDKEIEALRMMENGLDNSLTQALDLMQKTTEIGRASCRERV